MGPKLAQAAYVNIKAIIVMVDASAMVETLQGRLTRPMERVTIAMSMD